MKKYVMSFAVVATLISSSSFAALNSYLQIKGSKGSSQIVSCPNGTCTIPSLVADTYTVSVVDAQGKPSSLDTEKYECSVITAREAGSGMATGKRQYQPLLIRKEISSASIVVAKDETNLAITCSSSGSSVAAPATTEAAAKTATYDLKKATK